MRAALTALALILSTPALAAPQEGEVIVPCGGSFPDFVQAMEQAAVARGADPATARAFFSGVRQDPATLDADRRQGVFTLPFTDFARRLISQNRLQTGRALAERHDATFDRVEAEFGVSRGVLLAFWAFETDFGAVQGDFNTVNALMTLGHDCRRPGLFQPQVLAALELYARGDIDPRTTTGAWAGEIGMVQMLPEDILTNGIDGDGDGRVTLKTSAADALMSGGNMLSDLGWRANEPWLEEVTVPADMDWSRAGLTTRMTPREWASRRGRAASRRPICPRRWCCPRARTVRRSSDTRTSTCSSNGTSPLPTSLPPPISPTGWRARRSSIPATRLRR